MKVVILRGIPGCGKSTYLNNNYGKLATRSFSADYFFEDPWTKEFKYAREKLGLAHGDCLRLFMAEISNSLSPFKYLVVDNTNISIADISPYVAIANAYGVEHEILTLKIDPSLAKNIHGVPDSAVKKLHKFMELQEKHFPKHWNHRVIENYR